MNKKLLLSFLLLVSATAFAVDIKISQLPLGSASTTGGADSFPFVSSAANITKRMTIWDIPNIPTIVSTYAPKASPAFTGSPTAPTQSPGDNSTKLATTAYADALVSDTAYNATSWNGVTGISASKNAIRDQMILMATLASPALTGTPTAPTASALDNSTKIATTAYADGAVSTLSGTVTSALALKAPLASPALTGSPTAPTQSALDSSTKIATTAYADSAVSVSGATKQPLDSDLTAIAALSATGIPVQTAVGTWTQRSVTGTSNTITVTNGNGVSGAPTITIADNVVLPGTASATLPIGTTAQRNGSPIAGMIRYNSDLTQFEGYKGGTWGAIGGARYVAVFTGTSVTPDASSSDQTFLYTGSSAQTFSTTGFGTISSLANGTIIKIMGSSDTNTITIAASDITDGRLINGDAELGKGQVVTFEYNSTLARMVETSRNF